jgi:hypothetical protein
MAVSAFTLARLTEAGVIAVDAHVHAKPIVNGRTVTA